MRNIYDKIKVFTLQEYTAKNYVFNGIEFTQRYQDNAVACIGCVIDGMYINLYSLDIYPYLIDLNDFVELDTCYVTDIYNYGESIVTGDGSSYTVDISKNEAKEYHARVLQYIEYMRQLEENGILWYSKEKAKILQKRTE